MAEHIVSFLFDAILVGLIAFIVIRYSIRGFVKSFLSVIKILLAPLLAVVFCLPFARLISGWIFESPAKSLVFNWLTSTQTVTLSSGETAYNVDSFFDGIPNFAVNFLLKAGEDDPVGKALITKHFAGYTSGADPVPATIEDVDHLSVILGNRLALAVSAILSFIIIFIIVEIIVLIFSKLINKLLKKAVTVKRVDIFLGALVGIFVAILMVWVLSFIIGLLFEFGNHHYENVFKNEYIENTFFLKFFIDHNFLAMLRKLAIG